MPRWNYSNWEERFWNKVDKKSDDECWEWIGGLQSDGYGSLGMKNKETGIWSNWPAHRVSWLIHFGSVPEYPKLEICHVCDNRKCVNPNHLFVASHVDNIKDMYKKERSYDRTGSNNPNAKLNKESVMLIRESYKSGTSCVELAKQFNIHKSYMMEVIDGKFWKDI